MEKFFVELVFGLTIGILVWKSAEKRDMNGAAWGMVCGLSGFGGILLPVIGGIIFLLLRMPLHLKDQKKPSEKNSAPRQPDLASFNEGDYRKLVNRYKSLDDEELRGLSTREESLRREAVKALEAELERRGLSVPTAG